MRRSMHSLTRLPAALATSAWLLLISPIAYAQSQPEPPLSSEQPPNISDIPEQKIEAAVTAMEKVARVKNDYEQRIDAAQHSEKARIADEANSAMVKAVTEQGLSVAEYTAILIVAENDVTLRERILQRIAPNK
jgi:hypothetical protein